LQWRLNILLNTMMLPRPCVDCGTVVRDVRCLQCKRIKERGRPSRLDKGYDYKWRKLSKQLRAIHPWCKQCGVTKDLTVDHIIPLVDLDPSLRYEISNLQVLCRKCNSEKGDR
jgi:5-methylcytosine-specific restriction endonuclease McrA